MLLLKSCCTLKNCVTFENCVLLKNCVTLTNCVTGKLLLLLLEYCHSCKAALLWNFVKLKVLRLGALLFWKLLLDKISCTKLAKIVLFTKLRWLKNHFVTTGSRRRLFTIENWIIVREIFALGCVTVKILHWGALLLKFLLLWIFCVGVRYCKILLYWKYISRYFWYKLYLRSLKRHKQCLMNFYYYIIILDTACLNYKLYTNFACW